MIPERRRGRPKRPASKRQITRDFFLSPVFRRLGLESAVIFLACILEADDEGRFSFDFEVLLARIRPKYVRNRPKIARKSVIIETLIELERERMIYSYQVDDDRVIQIVKWHMYQYLRDPCPSRWPPPDPVAFEQFLLQE